MDNLDIVVLRILHIVSGAFWVGAILFMTLFLRPRLRALGDGAARGLTESINGAVNTSTGVAGLITVAAGIGLVLRLRWGHFDTFFNSGWGYAISIGIIAATAAFVVGGIAGNTYARFASIGDDSPESEGATMRQALETRIVLLERLHALFVLIAVGSMASARFV